MVNDRVELARPIFTKREKTLVSLLLKGKTNKHIAQDLHIVERTVEFHLRNVYEKLGVSTRLEAVLLIMRDGKNSSE